MTPNDTPEPGQFPAPVAPPPKGLVHLILRHRFLVVSLVVVLFLGVAVCLGRPERRLNPAEVGGISGGGPPWRTGPDGPQRTGAETPHAGAPQGRP